MATANRHAYLLMCHDNPWQFGMLIRLLDDARNDLFIHIDRKSKDFPVAQLKGLVQSSRVFILPRRECRWAEYSQMETELELLRTATEIGNYRYYHLLSGQDLPLKTQDKIHAFFDARTEEFAASFGGGKKYHDRYTKYRHPFLKCNGFRNSRLLKAADMFWTQIQELFGMDVQRKRNTEGWFFCDGWTWFSITDGFARYILSKHDYIQSIFQYAKAPDEFFIPTLLHNSPYRECLFGNRNAEFGYGSMRHIDWRRGKPYVFRSLDFDELMASPCLFARKFDERIDREIIERIFAALKKN